MDGSLGHFTSFLAVFQLSVQRENGWLFTKGSVQLTL